MNDMNVQKSTSTSPQAVLQALSVQLQSLTPEVHKAASFILENPNNVGVSSIREIANAARVKPNTFVRMARTMGFQGYEDFREPFREHIKNGGVSFPDRARWLQSLSKGGKLGGLYGELAAAAISNIEHTFSATNAVRIKAAADAIVNAQRTYVLGVGINHTLARNFTYLADMALENVRTIPGEGNQAIDDLARAGDNDVLLAMTFKPYRTEVVEAVEIARKQGVTIIGISDSPASPITAGSEHGFVVPTDTPQFFTSTFATLALLETLVAFVVADASPNVIKNIESIHKRRHALGIYLKEGLG